MDPVAHTLVGAALAASGLRRATPLSTAALVIGANLPDVDALCYLGGGADLGLWCRRGWTHGLLAVVVWPFLLALALLLWARLTAAAGVTGPRTAGPGEERPRPIRLLLLGALAVATHPALDWMNTYGMRWLMPFSGNWYYGDALFIVDPWLWLLLGGGVFLAGAGSRRARWEWALLGGIATVLVLATARAVPLAARLLWLVAIVLMVVVRRVELVPRRIGGEATVRVALAAAIAYVLAMLAMGRLARREVRAELLRRGVATAEADAGALMVGPWPANPFVWEVVAAAANEYRFGRFTWLPRPRLELSDRAIPRPVLTPVIEAARGAPGVRGMVNWARFPYYEVEEDAEGYAVYLLDARYARARTRGFGGAAVRLDRSLRPR